ncbi:DNA-directed RNA polymerase specialized sigma subunit [Pelotomaculum thermopropionicum SI]|uniref:DNA-directed RNA polymerase specialized sigma subunit n=1 Tax=Pelotomaculum thermopropionicum (strain DSM 13744 / JCM 10971 / SI) TaxID=370438 RepID=A5D356_PELTS|nr:DNA-directed RNA polymerase specialized sigma subunit [Pelotomaculum thermopropionicum SI]
MLSPGPLGQKGCVQAGNIEAAMAAYLQDGSAESLQKVVEAGTRLVHYFVGLYAPGHSREDLVQSGFEGLLKAAKRYDPGRGVSFSTYASHCIMGEVRHFIRKEASFSRPGWAAGLQERVNRFLEEYLNEKGELPTLDQIAGAVNIRKEGLLQVMRVGWVAPDEIDVSKIRSQRYESFQLPVEDRIVLRQAVEKLTELQRRVIAMLFFKNMTQGEAAEELGITQRKVSRVLHKSLKLLRDIMSP